jgi:hypothetical protein
MSLMYNPLPRMSNGHRREMQKSLTEKLANSSQNDYNNVPGTICHNTCGTVNQKDTNPATY